MNPETFNQTDEKEYPPLILFFDSECLLCHRSVRWIIKRDTDQKFLFASLNSKTADRLIPETEPLRSADTVILRDFAGLHGHSEAVFRVIRRLKGISRILLVFSVLPRRITDLGYRFIAARRYRWFGKDESCPLPDPSKADRFLE